MLASLLFLTVFTLYNLSSYFSSRSLLIFSNAILECSFSFSFYSLFFDLLSPLSLLNFNLEGFLWVLAIFFTRIYVNSFLHNGQVFSLSAHCYMQSKQSSKYRSEVYSYDCFKGSAYDLNNYCLLLWGISKFDTVFFYILRLIGLSNKPFSYFRCEESFNSSKF